MIERSGSSVTVTFRRTRAEKVMTVIVAFVAAQMTYFALRINLYPQQKHLVCDRSNDVCSVTGHDIFGSEYQYTFPASSMKRSRVVDYDRSERKWTLERSPQGDTELGLPSGRAVQKQQYEQFSAALQAFIDDPKQRSYEARFDALGGPSGAIWIGMGLFFAYVLLRIIHGFRTRLVIDRGAGQVIIHRMPNLWPLARRTIPLADVVRAKSVKGGMLVVVAYVRTIGLRLIGRHGRVLFARRMLWNQKTEAEIHEDVEAVNSMLSSSESAA